MSLDQALAVAAEWIVAAHAPLFTGIADWSVSAQQLAAEIVRHGGGYIDAGQTAWNEAEQAALWSVGLQTATLGHLRQVAEVAVCWYCDPTASHPRLFERFLCAARRLVIIADPEVGGEKERPLGEDPRIERWSLGRCEARPVIEYLHSAVQGSPSRNALRHLESAVNWIELAATLRSRRYSVMIWGGDSAAALGPVELTELHGLVRGLNDISRCAGLALRSGANRVGAESVLNWTFGFPGAIRVVGEQSASMFGEFSAEQLIVDGGCDLVVWGKTVEASGLPSLIARRPAMRTIVLDSTCAEAVANPCVNIPVAQVGWDAAGDLCRLDGLTLHAPAIVAGDRPAVEDVLIALARYLAAARDGGARSMMATAWSS